jgi:hypothetical protein
MLSDTRPHRVARVLDVRVHDASDTPVLDLSSRTVNLGPSGVLMHLPIPSEVGEGEDVVLTLKWPEGSFTSRGRVVRFESPYQGDLAQCVMGIHLETPVPDALLLEEGM